MYVPFLPTNNHTTAQLFSGDFSAFLLFVLSKGTTPRKQNTAEQKQADKNAITHNKPSKNYHLLQVPDSIREKIDDRKLELLYHQFRLFDTDGSGLISCAELGLLLRSVGENPVESRIQEMVKEVDQDETGDLSFGEFVTLWFNYVQVSESEEQLLRMAFEFFDKDSSGTIELEELREVLMHIGDPLTGREVDTFFTSVDRNGDGVIQYEEFMKFLKEQNMNRISAELDNLLGSSKAEGGETELKASDNDKALVDEHALVEPLDEWKRTDIVFPRLRLGQRGSIALGRGKGGHEYGNGPSLPPSLADPFSIKSLTNSSLGSIVEEENAGGGGGGGGAGAEAEQEKKVEEGEAPAAAPPPSNSDEAADQVPAASAPATEWMDDVTTAPPPPPPAEAKGAEAEEPSSAPPAEPAADAAAGEGAKGDAEAPAAPSE